MQKHLWTALTAICVFLLVASTMSFAGIVKHGPRKACRGVLRNENVTHAASHFLFLNGDGRNAGTIASSRGYTDCLGKVTVEASSSWDWGLFSNSETNNLIEEEAHPCALVNTTAHTFSAANDTEGTGFTTYATVTIRKKIHGHTFGTIEGVIRGGSVCEIEVQTTPTICTVNEGMTAFEITDSTGVFRWVKRGSGLLHTIFDFCTGEFLMDEIFLHLNR